MSHDPDKPCMHVDFEAHVAVNRLFNDPMVEERAPDLFPDGFNAEVRVNCRDCGEPFRFVGCKAGLRPDRPMVDPAETELRVPIRPASSDPDFGLGIPGFAINMQEDER